ncbi:sensor histidine kinase [Altibacter sp. HG106]|uniref:sensor histidine kinase n=1 Tax=Altibacter sp. HG106 TaxID=3023937 RepID=UPI00235020A6|nr:hypothetical protein [Altibacter sp. HG106]MDC7993721.1 hypothetical protein [Altibacter sp. HG106]
MYRNPHTFLFLVLFSSSCLLLNTNCGYGQTQQQPLDSILNSLRGTHDAYELVEGMKALQTRTPQIEQQPKYYRAYIYEVMAHSLYKLGDAKLSEENAVKALGMLKKEDVAARVRLLCLLGILQQEKGLFDLAHLQYQRALSNSNNTLDSLYILNNQATLFKERRSFKEAIATYRTGLSLISKMPSEQKNYHQIKFLDNLGNTLSLASQGGESELLQALTLQKSQSNAVRTYSIHRHLVQHYLRLEDTVKAKLYATEMHRASQDIGDTSFEKEALGLLLSLDQAKYAPRYVQLSDSLSAVKQDVQNAYALLKYDKSEAERAALSAKINQERILFLAILGGLFILFPSVWLILRHKRKRRQAVFETERAISQHIHDDIANNLFMIMNTLSEEEDTETLDAIEKVYQQARSLSRSHNAIDSKRPFLEILSDLFHHYSTTKIRVIPKNTSTIPWDAMSNLKREALYKVLQELLTNTHKHSGANFVVISFKNHASKVHVHYRDNGVGTEGAPENGLRYAENRIKAVSGSITFTSNHTHGFQAEIII